MATYDPDKEMFDAVKDGIKNLTDILTKWQQKENAIHSMAEVHARNSGSAPEHMDAQVYSHKKALKKAMMEHAKQNEGSQGVPSAQDMPGGPMSQVVPGPQGAQSQGGPGVGGSRTAGPGPLVGPPTGPTPGGQGGPGVGNPSTMVSRNTPYLPMAGQTGNTGANGWENMLKPSPYPEQAVIQNGQRPESTGPLLSSQKPLPKMPARGVPGTKTGTNPRFQAHERNVFPTASAPLTRPMR